MCCSARVWGGIALALAILATSTAVGQERPQELPFPRTDPNNAKNDRADEGQPILPTSAVRGLSPAVPVTLGEILKLASIANLDVVQANLVIQRAQANVLRAKSIYFPTLRVGPTYTEHEGAIQRTEGTVVDANRDALFVGVGSTLTLSLSDAIYVLPEARRRLDAAVSGQVRVTNDVLLTVANAYFNVLRARRQLARLDETLDFLTSERESPLRGGSKGLLPLIRAFVESGTALPSDQARVEADVVRRMSERSRAAQDVRTAAAELSRLLHLNAAVFLMPSEDFRWPLDIPGAPWFHQPIDALIMQGLQSRPELAENAALLQAAYLRYRRAVYQPVLPEVVVNYSYGGFGGGPTVVGRTETGSNLLGHSGVIADFGQRHDLELGLLWRFQGFGIGNRAQAWDNRVRMEQREVQQLFLQDLVVAQIVQSLEQIQRAAERVRVLRASLFDAQNQPTGAIYRSLRLNFLRIKGGQGLPLEVLDSTRRLSDVLNEYANALTDYDQARFRMLVSLGFPPGAILEPKFLPMPPNCPAPMGENGQSESTANLPAPRRVDKNAGIEKNGTVPERDPARQPQRPRIPDDGLAPIPLPRPNKP